MSKTGFVWLFLVSIAAVTSCFAQSQSTAQSQGESQAVLDAIDRGDAFSTQHQYQQALDAYREADRISNHTCADCLLGMVNMECYLGDFATALDDAKRAETVAGGDRMVAAQACEVHAKLLASTAGDLSDARMKEVESDLRQALTLDPKKSGVRFELGMLLLEEGRDSEGVAELKAYISGPLANPRYIDRANRLIADPSRVRAMPSEDFSIATLDGGTISKSGLRGKVVLLDFWASWCGPCRESMPAIVDLHQKYSGNSSFQIVGISADIDQGDWKSFVSEHHMTWPQNLDADGRLAHLFDVPGFPTYVLLDRDGAIAYRQTGFGEDSESRMAVAINRALAKPISSKPEAATSTASAAAPPAATPAPAAAAAPPRNIRVNFTSPPDDVGNDDVRGNVYRNDFLGLTLKFPASWTVEQPEDLEELNRQKMRRLERAEQDHPADATGDSVSVAFPQIVFQASPSGRSGAPSVTVSVAQTDAPLLESALKNADRLKQEGITILAPPREILAAKRGFVRTDTQSAQLDPPVWTATLETAVSRHFRVIVEIQARSKQELDELASSIAPSLVISKP
jgi:cytochrome c biogenesis protein CcmG, thiol:disulfide interchange protein DsbE